MGGGDGDDDCHDLHQVRGIVQCEGSQLSRYTSGKGLAGFSSSHCDCAAPPRQSSAKSSAFNSAGIQEGGAAQPELTVSRCLPGAVLRQFIRTTVKYWTYCLWQTTKDEQVSEHVEAAPITIGERSV